MVPQYSFTAPFAIVTTSVVVFGASVFEGELDIVEAAVRTMVGTQPPINERPA
jgi:hypothetical protein